MAGPAQIAACQEERKPSHQARYRVTRPPSVMGGLPNLHRPFSCARSHDLAPRRLHAHAVKARNLCPVCGLLTTFQGYYALCDSPRTLREELPAQVVRRPRTAFGSCPSLPLDAGAAVRGHETAHNIKSTLCVASKRRARALNSLWAASPCRKCRAPVCSAGFPSTPPSRPWAFSQYLPRASPPL